MSEPAYTPLSRWEQSKTILRFYRWPLALGLLALSGTLLYMSIDRYGTVTLEAGVDRFNHFDVSNALIPQDEILRGGPGRDGIPAILEPKFESAADASWLRDEDIILGVEHDGESRAYPFRILVWHELVNDTIGDKDFLATYCPLCGTAMVFDRRVEGEAHTFGVSGLLYHSDVLMYDHETESLWSQLGLRAVTGPRAGTPLQWIPATQSTWAAWREEHPDTKVLSRDTGYLRNYNESPYIRYENSAGTIFPVPYERPELPKKDWVVGLILNGEAKAYPVAELDARPQVEDTVGGETITVHWDSDARRATARSEDGEVPTVQVYWFAWQAFYPNTGLYTSDAGGSAGP